jgi:putative protease
MSGIAEGKLIFRNYDHKFHQLIGKAPAERKIGLWMRIYETADGIALEGIDEDGNCTAVTKVCEKKCAKKKEEAYKNISAQLTRLGNTIFECRDIKIELGGIYFFPVSALNQLRRNLAEAILQERLSKRPVCKVSIRKNDVPYPEKCLDYTGNVFNEKARKFYERHGIERTAPAAESGIDLTGKRVMRTKYCIRHQLGLCPGPKRNAAAEALVLINEEENQFELRFRCADCGMDIYLLSRKAAYT